MLSPAIAIDGATEPSEQCPSIARFAQPGTNCGAASVVLAPPSHTRSAAEPWLTPSPPSVPNPAVPPRSETALNTSWPFAAAVKLLRSYTTAPGASVVATVSDRRRLLNPNVALVGAIVTVGWPPHSTGTRGWLCSLLLAPNSNAVWTMIVPGF